MTAVLVQESYQASAAALRLCSPGPLHSLSLKATETHCAHSAVSFLLRVRTNWHSQASLMNLNPGSFQKFLRYSFISIFIAMELIFYLLPGPRSFVFTKTPAKPHCIYTQTVYLPMAAKNTFTNGSK